jgi:hypothetical protein
MVVGGTEWILVLSLAREAIESTKPSGARKGALLCGAVLAPAPARHHADI